MNKNTLRKSLAIGLLGVAAFVTAGNAFAGDRNSDPNAPRYQDPLCNAADKVVTSLEETTKNSPFRAYTEHGVREARKAVTDNCGQPNQTTPHH